MQTYKIEVKLIPLIVSGAVNQKDPCTRYYGLCQGRGLLCSENTLCSGKRTWWCLRFFIFLFSLFLLPILQVQQKAAFGLTYCPDVQEIVAGQNKTLLPRMAVFYLKGFFFTIWGI